MTLKEALGHAQQTLAWHGIDDPRIEAELLLRHVLGLSRAQLYLRLEQELDHQDAATFDFLIKRRVQGEPAAYIVGHREFYGLDFLIVPKVLIPRPESELLVEKALEFINGERPCLIADVGTGCGAIAIAIAKRLPQARVYATDISAEALEIAQANCQKHAVANQVHLFNGDLLDPLPEPVDLIIANLPYVKDSDWARLASEIRVYEPKLALAGGADGLDRIGQLLAEAGAKLRPGGAILVEIGYAQGPAVLQLARGYFPEAVVGLTADLSGIDRVVSIKTS